MEKIIGTIGPSSIDVDVLKKLKAIGLNSFRINLSHSNEDLIDYYYKQFKLADVKPSLDTQGAQIRVTSLKKTKFNSFGEIVSIGITNNDKCACDIGLNHEVFFKSIEEGDEIKLGFGGLIVKIISIKKEFCQANAQVLHVGEIELNKAVDITNKLLELPPFTDFDIQCIYNSKNHDIQEIFISFCSDEDCIHSLKTMLLKSGWGPDQLPKIIAKIESRKGLFNLRSIANAADGILIDRGDLSREIKISMVPGIVETIIMACKECNSPCYIATNILDSMMREKLPSRAEISDIYNLLSLGISGFVLAAEVAIGNHPIESVEVVKYMSSIFFHHKNNTGIIPSPREVVPSMKEPLLSWL